MRTSSPPPSYASLHEQPPSYYSLSQSVRLVDETEPLQIPVVVPPRRRQDPPEYAISSGPTEFKGVPWIEYYYYRKIHFIILCGIIGMLLLGCMTEDFSRHKRSKRNPAFAVIAMRRAAGEGTPSCDESCSKGGNPIVATIIPFLLNLIGNRWPLLYQNMQQYRTCKRLLSTDYSYSFLALDYRYSYLALFLLDCLILLAGVFVVKSVLWSCPGTFFVSIPLIALLIANVVVFIRMHTADVFSLRGQQQKDNPVAPLLAVLAMFSCANFWSALYKNIQPNMSKRRFSLNSADYKDRYLVFFLLDCLVLLVPLIVIVIQSIRWHPVLLFASIPPIILLITNGIVFTRIHTEEVFSLRPMVDAESYVACGQFETSKIAEKPLSVLESGAFRIVVKNCGSEPWVSKIVIKRIVTYTVHDRGNNFEMKQEIMFTHEPQEPLAPGECWTFIPAYHTGQGCIKIEDYRAFGRHRGKMIVTKVGEVGKPDEARGLVRMIAVFEKSEA